MESAFEILERELRYPIQIDGDCWLFTGGSKNGRHGTLYYKGKSWQAHCLALTLIKGSISEGLFGCHTCDVGMCINPDHLYAGTHQQNMDDMRARGREKRSQSGENNGRSVVTAYDVICIRTLHALGKSSLNDLSQEFGINKSSIHKIVTGIAWSHI